MDSFSLRPFSALMFEVLSAEGAHVGNLKQINGVWKFKALGYDAQGEVMPGHGPLTAQHNLVFAVLDEALICARLAQLPDLPDQP